MDLSVDDVISGLFQKESMEQPSDRRKLEEQDMELPKWFDEKKFNKGRRFFWDFSFSLATSMMFGLIAVISVPSILKILVSTRRSNSVFTAYRRYLSTLLHVTSWFENELKPGSISWKSLHAVRKRHFNAGLASKTKGLGVVSQRDMALTLFGFIGYSILMPEKFGVMQLRPDDWESYNHLWSVIGHMIGLEDRYNICRKTPEETRQICQILLDRVYTPSMENVPEHFEHAARVLLDGLSSVNPTVEIDATLFWCRRLSNVPGYVYTEEERVKIQEKLRKHLKGKNPDTGVDSRLLIEKPLLDDLPDRPPRLLYLHDYDTLDQVPAYRTLSLKGKFKLALGYIGNNFYSTFIGRAYFNWNHWFSLYLMKYFPYIAFFRFGIKKSIVNIFEEDPIDDTEPKPNAEYNKPRDPLPWYRDWLSLLW
ncbi:uncharacterized protein LOC113513629 isoform X2 [Galleria mellonella]|uniref:Uncharacterized protein LOC113513629 isoform X2 n=1 Tax=Galleria mellonella TaxID=7137 RepID=A0ABM3MK71_GALME|nr:uncharacterized protein LOC113513629 isoform X2 [Galleria mellonella]